MPIYVALGANQNSTFMGASRQPIETFRAVIRELKRADISVTAVSGLWESPAWPDPETQAAYNNAVIEVKTCNEPIEFLKFLKRLEKAFGRRHGQRNAPRPLDLDILDFDGKTLRNAQLELPHPRMCDRPFVLFPLSEIAPDWRDPIKNRAILDWIARLEYSDVKPLKKLGNIF